MHKCDKTYEDTQSNKCAKKIGAYKRNDTKNLTGDEFFLCLKFQKAEIIRHKRQEHYFQKVLRILFF